MRIIVTKLYRKEAEKYMPKTATKPAQVRKPF